MTEQTYVALFRGINVGPSKRIAMADLRALLGELGYTGVKTHLQSGNAVFATTPVKARTAAADIEEAVQEAIGVQSTVVLRSAKEFARAVDDALLLEAMTDPSKFLVGFFGGKPARARLDAVAAQDHAPDQVAFTATEVYLWCPNGVLDSPFSKVKWDREVGVPVTMRNWNTVTKVRGMLPA